MSKLSDIIKDLAANDIGETPVETTKRLYKLCDTSNYPDDSIYPPPMDAQIALNELADYFLGDSFYISDPIGPKQINMLLVYNIERKAADYKYNEKKKKKHKKKKKIK